MAITATVTLNSAAGDLTTNALSLSDSASLTKAGLATAIANTSGLARKTTSSTDQYTLFYADEYTADKAHKIYLKNTETTAALYFTIHIDDEPMGRLYAGDWALFPWSAADGTKEVFTITFSGTWAAADTVTFDGVTINADTAHATTAALVRATKYPNWTVSGSGSEAIFTSKRARADQEIDTSEWTIVDAGGSDAAIAVATTTEGLDDASNIKITPSTSASHTLEYMLFYE